MSKLTPVRTPFGYLTVRREARGQYRIENVDGNKVGRITRRDSWRMHDWYTELALGAEFYNNCSETLGDAWYGIEYLIARRRPYVTGPGRIESMQSAERFRKEVA